MTYAGVSLFSVGLGQPVIGCGGRKEPLCYCSIVTKLQFLSLFISCFQFTLSRAHLFFFFFFWLASGERLCVFLYASVSLLRGHIKGRITRTQTDCEVVCHPRKREWDGSVLSTGCLLTPRHHACWTECLKRSAFKVWDDMRRRSPAEVPGSLSFESSSVSNDKPRSSDGREQSEPPRPPATDYLPCFGASICHRATVPVSSFFSCTIKATSWQCWPCPLLSFIHKINQLVFVLEFLCCYRMIIKLARWALYWNLSCFLLFFFWHFSAINSTPVAHHTL